MSIDTSYITAILLPTGEVDYRMRDVAMAESLMHPDVRLGVMVFRTHTDTGLCPTCGRHNSEYVVRHVHVPVFVCDGIAYKCAELPVDLGSTERILPLTKPPTRWAITKIVADMALVDNRKVEWVINDWLEKNA
jgi:hypothetical protein